MAGSADHIFFEEIEIPAQRSWCLDESDERRGHFGIFFSNSNAGYPSLKSIPHTVDKPGGDKAHLIAIGPTSYRVNAAEMFDPYVGAVLDTLEPEDIFVNGEKAAEIDSLIKIIEFDDIKQDDLFSGRGRVEHIILNEKIPLAFGRFCRLSHPVKAPPQLVFCALKSFFQGFPSTFQTPLDKPCSVCYTGLTVLLLEEKMIYRLASALLCLVTLLLPVSCGVHNASNNQNHAASAGIDPCTLPEEPVTHPSQNEQAEIAIEMLEAAVRDEINVVDEHLGEARLKDLCLPRSGARLEDCRLLTMAALDIDRDGAKEFVIQSPAHNHIILRYHNGRVYSYGLGTRDFYRFNTDGSFYWHDPSDAGGWECGLSKVVFSGASMAVQSVYSLKYIDAPAKYEYFIGDAAVTSKEFNADPETGITRKEEMFYQFELTCPYPITAQQARDLAIEYWDLQDGCGDGAAGTVFRVRIVLTDTPNAETDYYRASFQVEWRSNGGGEGDECKPPYHIESHDQILVNAFTGEIKASTCGPDGRIISEKEAIEIVQKHCEVELGTVGYRFELDAAFPAPDHIYAITVHKIVDQHPVFHTSKWVDKHTGEIIFPYYVFGK